MPVQVCTNAVYTCDHCGLVMTNGLILLGGIMKIVDDVAQKPSGRAIAICSVDCAMALSDLEFS